MNFTRGGIALTLLFATGCVVGPNYKRPVVKTPEVFRGAAPGADQESLGDKKWAELFQDEVLKQDIETALKNNFDLAIATERVEEARARYRITGASRFPFLNATAGFTATRSSTIGSNKMAQPGADMDVSYTQAGGALSWELDLWGKLRRQNEAARAQYLATEEARRGVIVSLVSDVATTYFTLRERDLELEIARATQQIAEQNLKLVKLRHDRGAATGLAVQQAEQLLYSAQAQIPRAQRDIVQAEDALNLLMGNMPGDVARGQAVDDFGLPPEVPAGLPSSLLERRPDIRAAEQQLISANAQIGVARAYYFPQISLTGFLGGQSRALTEIFTGPARFWTVAPSAILPIFNAGQIRVAVKLSEAQKREMLVNYRKTIYNAFREVSDALAAYDRGREQRKQQENLVRAATEAARLSHMRYEGGLDSYLQVLDAERTLFQARLSLAQLRLAELQSFVQLYRALGGGWQ